MVFARVLRPIPLLLLLFGVAGCVGNSLDPALLPAPVPDTGSGGGDTGGGDTGGGDTGDGETVPPEGSLQHYFSTYLATPIDPGLFGDDRLGTPGATFPDTAGLGIASAVSVSARRAADGVVTDADQLTNVRIFPTRHLTEQFGPDADQPVLDAWATGWTGRGQTIAVIDDFQTASLPIYAEHVQGRSVEIDVEVTSFTGEITTGTKTLTIADVKHNITYDATHGQVVSMIAGGNYSFDLQGNFDVSVDQFTETSRYTDTTIDGLSVKLEDESVLNVAFGETAAPTRFLAAAGIAREALMVGNHVDLSSTQDPAGTIRAIYGHIDNSRAFAAVNVSISQNVDTVGMSYDQLRSMFSGEELQYKSDAVITVAAGNTGAPCGETDLNGCNALAVLFANLDQTRESTIVVGATESSAPFATPENPGTTETIATYSARAGALKDRFLLASGYSGFLLRSEADVPTDAAFIARPISAEAASPVMISGTSFAAPRVAGAAAVLRHKFPDLTGAQAASILLLTASKDINNDGLDDFTGVSETFGHGKLDLGRALSPIGTLVAP